MLEIDGHLEPLSKVDCLSSGPFGSRLLPQRRNGALKGAEFDLDAFLGEFLLNDDGVALGDGAVERVDFLEHCVIETPHGGTILKAGLGSSEITANGIAGDPQLSGNPFAPVAETGELVDPIHDFRSEHPSILLLGTQADWCQSMGNHLRITQVDQIRTASVHMTP